MIRDDPNWHLRPPGRGNLGLWSPFEKRSDRQLLVTMTRGEGWTKEEEDTQLCHPSLALWGTHLVQPAQMLLLMLRMMLPTGFNWEAPAPRLSDHLEGP